MPPSETTIIDPKIYAKVKYALSFVGTSVSGNLLQLGSNDAPRAFPLSQTTSTVSAAINGQTVSTLLSQYFNAVIKYGEVKETYDEEFSTTPMQLDQCVEYKDLNATNRSPFVAYGDNVLEQPRGGFSGINILTNTPTTATLELEVFEPLFLPGFMYNKRGLINVRTLNWLFTFGDLRRVWSHDATNGNPISSMTANISEFALIYKFITPKILDVIPRQCVYSYNEFIPSIQVGGAVLAGAQTTISMNSLNLQSIPERLYIFIRKQDQDLTFNDADSFFRIDQVSINWMNRTGLLASATPQSLYRMSSENGLSASWDSYNKYNGSVICLRLGKDIGLSSLQASGLLTNPQLSMTVKATNLSSATVTPQLFVEVMYEGCMTISANGSMSKSTAVLSSADVLNAELSGAPKIESRKSENFYGSGIVDDAVVFGKDLWQATKSGVDLGSRILPLVGLGNNGSGVSGGAISGGRRRKTRGGASISRDELAMQMEDLEY